MGQPTNTSKAKEDRPNSNQRRASMEMGNAREGQEGMIPKTIEKIFEETDRLTDKVRN